MKKTISFSLSIQREIGKGIQHLDSEVKKSMDELRLSTLLHQSGIRKEKGHAPLALLFVLIVLPLVRQTIATLWSSAFFESFMGAHKDTYYRFLNQPCFNWRKLVMLLSCRYIARADKATPLRQKTIIADDTLLKKSGEQMELVSYHFDHTTKRSRLGYQMLQVGYHNGARFCPVDVAFHTSTHRPNDRLEMVDKRTSGWKRRMESFEKKTDLLVQMLKRCAASGIDARFVLFDSWFAFDKVISQILEIGYGVVCRLKRNQTRYSYDHEPMTLAQLWRSVARHELRWVSSWQLKAAMVEVQLPLSGKVSLVFVRWTKKRWDVFLCTEAEMQISEVLDYYARRWAVESYFRDCKQLLELGKGQSESFDAVVAWASIVMIRYLILLSILAKKRSRGPLGPLFRELALEHMQAAMIESLWERIRKILTLSSQLFSTDVEIEKVLHLMDLVEDSQFCRQASACAKL